MRYSKGQAPWPQFQGVSDEDLFFKSEVNPDCFEELVRRYRRLFESIALRIVGYADFEDVAQEALARMLRFRHWFLNYDGTSFRHWACTVVRNVALTEVRLRNRCFPVGEQELHEIMGTAGSCESDCEMNQLVSRLLARTSVRRRVLLFEMYVEGLNEGEIAARHNIPLGTVKSNISRAKRELVAALPSLLR